MNGPKLSHTKAGRTAARTQAGRRIRSRRARRQRIALYRRLSAALFPCALLFLLFLSGQVLLELKKGQEPVKLTASLPSQSIPNDVLSDIQAFPGLIRFRAAYSAQAEIQVGSYRAPAEILGVDLSSWPLKVTRSAGAKRRGTAPLIVAGEGFFQTLTDEYGALITKRQSRIFQNKIETLEVKVTFAPSDGEAPLSMEPEPAGSTAPSFTGSFLALAEGDCLYMDAGQMKELLDACLLPSGISRVELEVKGTQNAENARKRLEKSGFIVE